MAAIFYDAVATNRSYSVYGLKQSAFSPYKTDIYVQGQNPGFKVGDYIKWVNYEQTKSFTAKVLFTSYTKYSSEYTLGYYILTIGNSAWKTNTGFGGQISIVSQTANAVEEVSVEEPEVSLFGKSKNLIIGVAGFLALYLLLKKK